MNRFSAMPTRERWWGWLLFVAVLVVYQPVWTAGFVWDDAYITNNPDLLGPEGLERLWTTSAADIGPLTFTLFWVEHAVWGFAPVPYHLVNVVLHAASAVVLWRVLLRLGLPGAWLGAALWALHPVQVESAAWIMETKNTLSGVFFLLSIFYFLKGRDNPGPGTHREGWNNALMLVFAALALASKSSTVILPMVLGLVVWWMERRWLWRDLVRLLPIFLMALVAGLVSLWTQKLQSAAVFDPQWNRTWPQRIAGAGDIVWFYLGKLAWPYPLSNNYPRWQIEAGQVVSYLPLFAVVVVLGVLWLNRETWCRPYFFALAYFLIALLPVLGLLDNPIFRYSLVFDHLPYLAGMGPLALAGAGLVRLTDFAAEARAWLRPLLSAIILGVLGLLSWQRAWVFQSEETLWSDTLVHNPGSWAAHNNLGLALLARGAVDEAMVQYREALALNANDAEAHYNLGSALLKSGRVDEALGEFQTALAINPNDDKFHVNLGLALVQKADFKDAMAEYESALKINPRSDSAHTNLGVALFQTGRRDEAMVHFQTALEINPDSDEAHNDLGNAFLASGRLDEAMTQYKEALRSNPDFVDAHQNLGVAFARKGQLDDAIAQFQAVVRLKPADAQAQKILAQLEAAAQRPEQK